MAPSIRKGATRALALSMVVTVGASLAWATAAAAAPNGVVISEFRTRGPAGGNDEYVELLNTTAAPVNISGWKLQGCAAASGSASTRTTVGTVTLQAGQHYLFTNNATGGYSGGVPGDQTYGTGFSDSTAAGDGKGGLRIVTGSDAVQDGAGLPGSPCREGTGLNLPGTSSATTSFQRKASETQDTDNNVNDFNGPQAADPDNLAGGGGPPPPPPDPTKISAVQGAGFASPLAGQTVTIEGVVTGIDNEKGASIGGANMLRTFAGDKGIYVQEEPGDQDADPSTSEGIFVGFVDNPQMYPVGTRVRLNGQVREQFGFTQINETINEEPQGLGLATPAQTPAVTVIDEAQAEGQTTLSDGGRAYYETLEGMLARLDTGTANSGGTNKFGELFLTPGTEQDRVFRTDDTAGPGGTPNDQIRSLIAADGDGGANDPGNPLISTLDSTTLTEADLFDTVSGAQGPVNFSFSNYKLVIQPATLPTVTKTGVAFPYDRLAAAGPRDLRVASFNVENFFPVGGALDGTTITQEDFDEKRDRIVDAIDDLLERPDVVAVQEVVNKPILDAVAAQLGGYTAFLEEGNDNRGIDVGFLVKDSVVASNARQFGKTEPNPTSSTCSDVGGLLFDRPPLAIDIDGGSGVRFTVFSNHFASKAAPDACREAQARFVRERAKEIEQAGGQVIVTGDLNAFEDEGALIELQNSAETSLTNLWNRAPEGDRYSFQFSGRLQTLDHTLITDGLEPVYEAFQYAHFDNDYFNRQDPTDGHKVSDHDPPVLTLALPDCAAVGAITDNAAGDLDPDAGEIQGGPAGEFINGGDGADFIRGGGGADLLCGGGGNDTILDEAGDDSVFGEAGNDILGAGTGDDGFVGGDGRDRVSYATRAGAVEAEIGTVGNGEGAESDDIDADVEELNGGSGDDTLTGDEDGNTLRGNPGDDTVNGGGGADFVRGLDGVDTVAGGAGDDTVEGNAGNDTLTDGTGADLVLGGDGNDATALSADGSRDYANCGSGADTFTISEGLDRANRNCETRRF